MEKLYGWLFTYNPFNDVWVAYHSDSHIEVSNNYLSPLGIRSKDINTLIALIIKGNGNLLTINKLV